MAFLIEIEAGKVTTISWAKRRRQKHTAQSLMPRDIKYRRHSIFWGMLKTNGLHTVGETSGYASSTQYVDLPIFGTRSCRAWWHSTARVKQQHWPTSRTKNGHRRCIHLGERLYPSLSGGEKQRVHLARVLTNSTTYDHGILMLDEPTSALDLAHQHNTLKIARELADNHNAAKHVYCTTNLAAQYSDRLVVLKDGNLVCDGSPWEAPLSCQWLKMFMDIKHRRKAPIDELSSGTPRINSIQILLILSTSPNNN